MQRKNKIWAERRSIQFKTKHAMTIHRVFLGVTFLATRTWLRPVSRGNRHFTVGGGRLRQSGPRPKGRLLRQPALEGLTRSARTDSPRQVGQNKFRRERRRRAPAAAALEKSEVYDEQEKLEKMDSAVELLTREEQEMEQRRLTLNSVSAVELNSRCNRLLQAFSSKLQNIQSQATVYPIASYRLSSRKLQYIQSQATGYPVAIYSTTSQWYLTLAIAKRCRLDKWIRQRFAFALRFSRWFLQCYCNEGEPAVARSVVMKKRQQLSEQLLNNLLEHIQLLGCNQRSRWKESMAEMESCKCLKSRGQDLYYSGK
ncbi:U-box domain-containing protein 44-like [Dorcoceras hygrometricum]|uniref:U-box domain-containing protein 44-like n=1 Tax=Dorcoceras hygrometricum TaxID=472368 RepID=A0A2Z7AGI4_9LAMI|nr:U-box domain-containing protein 44-like [Dorcoceras hygrometricum]